MTEPLVVLQVNQQLYVYDVDAGTITKAHLANGDEELEIMEKVLQGEIKVNV